MNLQGLLQEESAGRLPVPGEQPIASRMQDLEMILNVVRKVGTSLVLSDVLDLVLDEAIRITKSERGFLMLADGNRKLEFVTGRNAGGESILADGFHVSSSVLDDVFTTGESLCVEDALNDGRFDRRQSVLDLELKTIICSPLRTQERKSASFTWTAGAYRPWRRRTFSRCSRSSQDRRRLQSRMPVCIRI